MVRLQKRSLDHQDVLQLFHELLVRLSKSEFELFLVQAWLIWNQRNSVTYGGKIRDSRWLNKRALDYLTEFQQSEVQLQAQLQNSRVNVWYTPPELAYKLNFDAAIFKELNCSGFGAIIRNGRER